MKSLEKWPLEELRRAGIELGHSGIGPDDEEWMEFFRGSSQ
jgi:hypothetical protein